ncbi:MAG: glycoside hydrolase family 1 protein [Spirochaetales bacterium]|nr:glycoside hydrolase family 1 protein [Spirochaetales bacterium]
MKHNIPKQSLGRTNTDLQLPRTLLLGSATAATQIEGDDGKCNWSHWAAAGKIAGGVRSIKAADHWNRLEEDVNLMKKLNQECYRLSIEWSRVEPEEGQFSHEGLQHYLHEMQLLKEAGIIPLVTLHHFSCPQWLQEQGAWKKRKTVKLFVRFVTKVVETLGDLAWEYCTINEPNVFVNDTYMDGLYPGGGKNDVMGYFKAARHMIEAHVKSYTCIHELRKSRGFTGKTRVGFAHHLAFFDQKSKSPLISLSRRFMDYSFHRIFFKGMVEGKKPFPIGWGGRFGQRGKTYCDFLGINYYSRHIVRSSWNPATLFGQLDVEKNLSAKQKNDLGWEIYPEGLGHVIRQAWNQYKLPVFITENGLADAADSRRASFIVNHLEQVAQLIQEGVDIQRYFHWSLMDNLEWNDGYGPRFGLIEINYDTQERQIRPSGHLYAEICHNHVIPSRTREIIKKETLAS